MTHLKFVLMGFDKTQLRDFYQKGYMNSQKHHNPDFYLSLLDKTVKEICDKQGFDFDEVRNVNSDANSE